MKLQTTEELLKGGNMLRTGDVATDIPISLDYSVHRWVLRGCVNTGNIIDLCRILKIDYSDLLQEMLRYIRKIPADEQRLPADSTELELLPVEHFNQLEIPVPDFQETNVFQIHRARYTGTKAFRNTGLRNDWVWNQAGGPDTSEDLRGRSVARLVGLFKIRSFRSEVGSVSRLAFVQMLNLANAGRFHSGRGHIRVCKRTRGQDMRIVDIGTVIGQAHVVPSGERQWIVNHRIDLRMFNEIY